MKYSATPAQAVEVVHLLHLVAITGHASQRSQH